MKNQWKSVCWKVTLQHRLQARGVGTLEEQRPQRGPCGGGARDPGTAFGSVGQVAPAGRQQDDQPELEDGSEARLEARIRDLTEENARLLEQRGVLKRSLDILSERPPRDMSKSNR
jgi:hypothetical protein